MTTTASTYRGWRILERADIARPQIQAIHLAWADAAA